MKQLNDVSAYLTMASVINDRMEKSMHRYRNVKKNLFFIIASCFLTFVFRKYCGMKKKLGTPSRSTCPLIPAHKELRSQRKRRSGEAVTVRLC